MVILCSFRRDFRIICIHYGLFVPFRLFLFFLCSKSVVGGSTKSELVNVRVCNLMTLNTANIVNCSSLSSEYAVRSNEESCKILIKSEANCSCGIERHFFEQND